MRGNEDGQNLITKMSVPIFVLELETLFERRVIYSIRRKSVSNFSLQLSTRWYYKRGNRNSGA